MAKHTKGILREILNPALLFFEREKTVYLKALEISIAIISMEPMEIPLYCKRQRQHKARFSRLADYLAAKDYLTGKNDD